MYKNRFVGFLISIILSIIILTLNSNVYAVQDNENEQYAYESAVQHIIKHSVLSEEQIHEFEFDISYVEEDINSWVIHFYYTRLSCHCIEVWIKRQEKCVGCTCQFYSFDDYQNDVMYKQLVWPSVEAAIEWEKMLGPHEFWDAETNARFYNQYGYIPYWSELGFELHSYPHYDSAINETISEREAIRLANDALIQKYPDAESYINELKIGVNFVAAESGELVYDAGNSSESGHYNISYYRYIDETWVFYYYIKLYSGNGYCPYIELQYYP